MTKPLSSRSTPVRNPIPPTHDPQPRRAGLLVRLSLLVLMAVVIIVGTPGRVDAQCREDSQSRADVQGQADASGRSDAQRHVDSQNRADAQPAESQIEVLSRAASGFADAQNQADAQPAEYVFDRHVIDIGPALRQTVLTGFLLGGDVADLAVVQIVEGGDRRVQVFAFEAGTGMDEGIWYGERPEVNVKRSSPRTGGTWKLRMDARLRPGVTFVDIARIGNRDRLITGEPGRLNVWDPDSATEFELVSVTTSFETPHQGEVPHVDVTRDVNGDGRVDLVVPGAEGFKVFVQMESGAFADPVVTGPPADLDPILGADGYRYDPWSVSRIHEFDYNGDGRIDLVSWKGDRFEAHVQGGQGLLGPDPWTFTVDARFDTDDITELATGAMTGRMLHSFTDMNGDGIADMVIYALEGAQITDKRSAFEVHFGARGSNGGIRFASGVDITIQSDGNIQLAMERLDFGGDCEPGLVVTSIEKKYLENSIFKRVKGFMGDDVWLNLAFYRMEAGHVPDRPNATRRIQLDGAPSPREPGWVPLDVVLMGGRHALRNGRDDRDDYRRAFNKNLFIGDVTGNGRSDLLVEWTHRELHVYAGVPGPEQFAPQPQKVAVELPNDGEYAWMTDLNRDGRQDIVMHHPFTKRDAHGAPMELPGTEPHRVTLLIAR